MHHIMKVFPPSPASGKAIQQQGSILRAIKMQQPIEPSASITRMQPAVQFRSLWNLERGCSNAAME